MSYNATNDVELVMNTVDACSIESTESLTKNHGVELRRKSRIRIFEVSWCLVQSSTWCQFQCKYELWKKVSSTFLNDF